MEKRQGHRACRYCGKQRGYYERFMAGKTGKAGWVSKSDYETEPAEK